MSSLLEKKRPAGVASLILSIFLAELAAAADEVVELEEVEARVVDGKERLVIGFGEGSERVLEADRARRGTLGEALSGTAGISSTAYTAGASRPVLRGMEGRRVGIQAGGLELGDLSASSPDHAVAMEPLLIDSVEIVHGAAALKHGGASIGGAIDVRQDHLVNAGPSGGGIEAGTFAESVNDGVAGYLKAGGRAAEMYWRLNLLGRESDDYAIPGMARTASYDQSNRLRVPPGVRGQIAPNPEGRVPNTQVSTRAAALGLGGRAGGVQLITGLQGYSSRYGVPLDGHTHGNPFGIDNAATPSALDGIEVDVELLRWEAEARLIDLPLDGRGISVHAAASDYRHAEWEGEFLSNRFAQRTAQARLALQRRIGRWAIDIGSGFKFTRYENLNISYGSGRAVRDELSTEAQQLDAFLLQELELPAGFRLRGGLRSDYIDTERRDLIGVSRRISSSSGWLELEVPLGSVGRIIVGGGKVQRPPSAEELFIEAPHGAIGVFQLPDPTLRTESARVGEVRWYFQSDRLQLGMAGFLRDFDNFIYLRNLGYEVDGLVAHRFRQSRARFHGGEFSARWLAWREDRWKLHLDAFTDAVRGEDRATSQPLPRMPADRAGLGMATTAANWQAGVRWIYHFRQNRVPIAPFGTLAYQSPSDAYQMLSASLSWRAPASNGSLWIQLSASNLLNQTARQHASFLKDVAPLPGRSWQIAMVWQR